MCVKRGQNRPRHHETSKQIVPSNYESGVYKGEQQLSRTTMIGFFGRALTLHALAALAWAAFTPGGATHR